VFLTQISHTAIEQVSINFLIIKYKIMSTNNFLAGLGGALVLTILNESLQNVNDDMPRIDIVGEEAIQKVVNLFGYEIDDANVLFGSALLGDLVSNTAYFSLIGGQGKELWTKAVSSGLLAGYGAITIPSKIELDDTPVAKTFSTKLWTLGYYMIGALTTATILQLLDKRK
jgi:hypothetical protein